MKHIIWSFFAFLLVCTGIAQAHPQGDDASRFVTTRIKVEGVVENPLDLDVAALQQFSSQKINELSLICQSGADRGKLENFRGVLLRDLLAKAVIKAPAHNDVKKMAIIATASDGYKAVFSWNEIFNSPIGDGVLVFFEKNNLPLGNDEGRIAMVSTQDVRTGPRHVKWLQQIEVRKITE